MRLFRLHKFQILKGIYYFSVFFLASGFSYVAFADPPGSAYAPGATLDPSCAPGDTNCTVSSTATASGSDGYLQFNTSGSLASDSGLFWDNTNKRLGVGSSTPSAPLTVVGQVLAGYFTGTTTATSTFGGNLAINGTGTSTSNGGFDITAGCYAINGTCIGAGSSTLSVGGTGAIQFASGTSFAADATNFFWDDSANRLGIGTSTPSYSLDVNGDTNIATGSSYKYNGVNIANASTTLNNYFFGGAGNLTMTGSNNTANGYQSLYSNISGANNTALGYQSLYTATTTGSTTAVGYQALYSNTTGYNNTANGYRSLYANTTGYNNTAFGRSSLQTNTTGNSNTATGAHALNDNTVGGGNTAMGGGALASNTTTSFNSAFGGDSLYYSTGQHNTAMGYQTGVGVLADNRSVTDGYVTFLGSRASRSDAIASTTALTNITAIGYNAKVGASNSMVLGGTGADAVKVGIGTTTPSFTLDVNGDANIAAGSSYKYNGVNIANASTTIGNYFFGGAGNLIMTGGANIGMGPATLFYNLTGSENTAIGYYSLARNTSGHLNTAMGNQSLFNNSTGNGNTAYGSYVLHESTTGGNNIGMGESALRFNEIGSGNVALGFRALYTATSTSNNTAVGYQSMYSNTGGVENTALGYGALFANTTGIQNAAMGYQSLYSNTTGYNNTAQGYRSMSSNTTGAGNTAIGQNALVTNSTGNDNTAVGLQAMLFNTSGEGNVAIGRSALSANTDGVANTAIGYSSLSANTSGMFNVANGSNALRYNTLGNYNTALGVSSLNANTTGVENTAVGHESGYGSLEDHRSVIDTYATFLGYRTSRDASVASTTVLTNITAIGKNAKVGASNSMVLGGTGADAVKVGIGTTTPSFTLDVNGDANIAAGSSYKYNGVNIANASTTLNNYFFGGAGNLTMTGGNNTATGYQSLYANTVGTENTTNGYQSLYSNISGSKNIAFGHQALYTSTSTGSLIAVGWKALYANTSGAMNVAIGDNALTANTIGNYNTANGFNVLSSNTTGNYNTAVGVSVLQANTTGGSNSAFGGGSLISNTTGGLNTGIGFRALRYNTTGSRNIAIGDLAGVGDDFTANQRSVIDNYSGFIGSGASRDQRVASTTALNNAWAIGYNAKVGASNSMVLGGTGADAVKVGIGTTTPSFTLDVNGDTNIAAGSAYKYNGVNIANASTTLNNYFFGGAGNLTMTGDSNTGSGYQSLYSNITGSSNVALGYQALYTATSTTGLTAVGSDALTANTTGSNNTAVGWGALQANTTGSINSAFGVGALITNTTGGWNAGFGFRALRVNSSGNFNTANGTLSLSANTTGGQNTASGYYALGANTTASANTAFGYLSGYGTLSDHRSVVDTYATFIGSNASRDASVASTTVLTNITAIGQNAKVGASNSMVLGGTGADAVKVGIGTTTPSFTLDVNGDANISAGSAYKYNGSNIITASTTLNNYFFGGAGNLTMTGAGNTATGYQALYSNISTGGNTAYGYRALRNATSSSMSNTAIGYDSLYANTSGSQNTAVGESSLSANTTGSYNTSLGRSALGGNTTGGTNTAVGTSALATNSTGNNNSAFGRSALFGSTTGSENVALGTQALYSNTTGRNNTAVGYLSGYGSLADDRSVIDTYATFLGHRASRDASVASTTVLTNITAIGQNAKVGASNSMVLGGTGADAVKVGIGTTTPSFTLDVNGDLNIAAGSAYKYNGSNIITASTTLNNYFFGGAGNLTMTGDGNNATGYQALLNNTGGAANFAVGWRTLLANTTGDNNTAFGNLALSANTSGGDNFAFGRNTLLYNTTGAGNIAIGYNAGGFGSGPSAPIEADRSIIDNYSGFIGAESRRSGSVVGLTALENAWAIGYRATVGQSNTLALGASNGVNNFKVGIGTSTPVHTLNVEQTTAGVVARFTNSSGYCDIDPTNTALVCTSDATLKKNVTTVSGALSAITSLRGVNFKWLNEDDSTHTHLGVIAQEVEQILPELVATDITTGKKSVNYIGFVPVLIEAVKELASRVSNLEARIAQGVSDGISNISDFVVDTLSAKKVVTETLEMKDSVTGETYCVKIANGEWDKTKGACASAPVNTQTASVIEAVTPPQEGETASSTPEVAEGSTPAPEPDLPSADSQQESVPTEQAPTEEIVPDPQSEVPPEESQEAPAPEPAPTEE